MKRRQFIAGAVCPACQQMDRIVVEEDQEARLRRCVACGFTDDTLPTAGVVPDSRLLRAAVRNADDRNEDRTKVRIVALKPAGPGAQDSRPEAENAAEKSSVSLPKPA